MYTMADELLTGGTMNRARWICLFFVMSAAAMSYAGDIQVSCSPGLRISLDGKFVGTSSAAQDGLFLSAVPAGAHTIRVEKDGFVPQNIRIEISSKPIEVRVGKLSPEPSIRVLKEKEPEPEEVEQLFGELVVTSAPQNCTVELDGKSEEKIIPQLSIGRIAAGEHTISFSKPGYETITDVFNVQPGTEVTVRGDLFAGKIETLYEGKGSLQVISNPKRCTIRFRGKIEDKIHSYFNLTHIPAGEYPIVVEIRGRKLTRNVLIIDGHKTVLEVSFVKGEEPFVVSYVPK
jgi:hypothetical protein